MKPDFRAHVRTHLPPLGVSGSREMDIVDELAQELRDRYEGLVALGRSTEDAWNLVQRETDWAALGQALRASLHGSQGVRPIDSPGEPVDVRSSPRPGWRLDFSAFTNEVRRAIHALGRSAGFSGVAVGTLALCLGTALTIFALVDAVLLRPLPFAAPERLVTVFNTYPAAGLARTGSSLTNYYERRGAIRAFSSVSLFRPGTAVLGEGSGSAREPVLRITPEFFQTLGVAPTLGRAFSDEEMTFQTHLVAILSHGFWRERFSADPTVIGRTVRVDGENRQVVGVLPPSFQFLSYSARVYLPLSSAPAARGPSARHSNNEPEMIARLRPGVSLKEAQAQVDAHNLAAEREAPTDARFLDAAARWSTVASLREDHVASIRPTLLLLQGGVCLLLVIGITNLVNLLLIRASTRARDVSIRQSLGASPWRVAVTVLAEPVVLVTAGGLAGLAASAAGLHLLRYLGVDQLPLTDGVRLDGRLVLMAVVTSLVVGLAIGMPVLAYHMRGGAARPLAGPARGTTGTRSLQRLRQALIVGEIALAFVLLTGVALLGLSLQRAAAVPGGFRAEQLVTGQVTLPSTRYPAREDMLTFADRLLQEVEQWPGVVTAGAAHNIPLSDNSTKLALTVPGYRLGDDGLQAHYVYGVQGNYLEAMQIPLLAGRRLDARDSARRSRVCVIDVDLARRYWPARDAVGQRLFLGRGSLDESDAFTVVGVVGRVKQVALSEPGGQGALYVPYRYFGERTLYVVTRTRGEPAPLASSLRAAVRSLDPELPLDDVRSMEARIDASLIVRRSPAILAAVFAGVAVLLTVVGTYAVVAYAVTQQRREIGLRMALGALPRHVRNQFLTRSATWVLAALIPGALGSWASARAMRAILFETPGVPVSVSVGMIAGLATVVLVASYLPAQRASRTPPTEALRGE